MQVETLTRILIKTWSKPTQRIYMRVPAGAFPHEFNAFSFHYTTDYAVSFSLTLLQKNIYRLSSSMILWYNIYS